MLYKLPEEQEKVLEEAAAIMFGKHGQGGQAVRETVVPLMILIASNAPSSGGHGTHNWLLALRTLGEALISLSKMLKESKP